MKHRTSTPLTLLLALLLLAAHADAAGPRQQQEPSDAAGHFARAVERHRAGRLEEAVAGYLGATRLRPEVAAAHINLGHAYPGLGRLDDAVAEIHYNLGVAHMAAGRNAEALATRRPPSTTGARPRWRLSARPCATDPRHPGANLKLGMEYLFDGGPAGARLQYFVLRDLDPEAAQTLLRLIEK